MPTAPSMMPVFQGDPITNAAEAACVRSLKRDLSEAGVDAVILANLTIGPKRRQIDLIVATEATAIVVEVKGYIHAVHGAVDGPWALELDDGSYRELDATNPYRQALENRFAVTDALRGAQGTDLKPAVGGMLCLYPSPPVGSGIPTGDFKAAIGSYSDLLALLRQPRPDAVSLERWKAFARSLRLKDESARHPTEAEQIVADYLAAHQDLSRATLGPYIEPLFVEETTTQRLATRCKNGEQFQIVGGSGSGKSELLKRLADACATCGNLPVFVRARDFDRDFGRLLRTATARCSNRSFPGLAKAAADAGAEIILHVDALNECPTESRPDLIAALQATRVNYGVRVLLSGQQPVRLPATLSGATLALRQPDAAQAQRMVEEHIGRAMTTPETGTLELVATAHDAAILAACLGQAKATDGRFALYHGFTRARLKVAGAQSVDQGLAALATAMRTAFVSAMPRAAAARIVDAKDGTAMEAACQAGLLWEEANRVGFRHDLIGDFFAAEALLRRAGSPAELQSLVRQPIHAELREFVIGGCATTREIAALLENASDIRMLESARSGRAGAKAKGFVLDRMRDLIGRLKERYATVALSLPEDFESARRLSSLVPSLGEGHGDGPGDALHLKLIAASVGDGLLPELLDLFAETDRRLAAEADRLRAEHPGIRLAWRAAAFETVYGMHHHPSGGRHLQNILHDIQNDFRRDDGENGVVGLRDMLDRFEELSTGQLFLLMSILRRAHSTDLPSRFPDLLRHIWRTQVYHLRLIVCDLIRFRGGDLDEDDREAVRASLDEFMTGANPFLNSILIDALEGVDGIETDFSVEDAVREYETILEQPESPNTRSLALSALTSTYDHPYRDTYWEAFYEALAPGKRQALLLRALRDERGDPWLIADVLRAMARAPDSAAGPELQALAQAPKLTDGSHQYAVICFADAIRLLAALALPLSPPDAPPSDPAVRAWYRAAPLLHALNGGPSSSLPADAVPDFVGCGTAEAFDVIQRLAREARNLGFHEHANMAFDVMWPEMVLGLVRRVLSRGYAARSVFPHFGTSGSLQDEHLDAALQILARIGRTTDMALVQDWLGDPAHGEQALRTARAIEAEPVA
ncbi:NERD domain-containing protein [Sphingomonas sp. Leaf28]|uniref:NERD domain-containing protein n=1 Tax=Sphingomonas sp. Leaf28 TaxID=1735695 RepID=UPI0007018F53|nr:nuclease-related domain-containing protein [Sphingomonas sp. Leaf28]KQN11658.1 hypothetical protein ASE79_06210 [Sphingomonas sp. Leaf28]